MPECWVICLFVWKIDVCEKRKSVTHFTVIIFHVDFYTDRKRSLHPVTCKMVVWVLFFSIGLLRSAEPLPDLLSWGLNLGQFVRNSGVWLPHNFKSFKIRTKTISSNPWSAWRHVISLFISLEALKSWKILCLCKRIKF